MALHSFIHSAATFLLRMGYDFQLISKMLGHTDFKTALNMYSHFNVDDLQPMAGKFNSEMVKLITGQENE